MWVSCLSKFHLSIAMARRIGIPSFWHIHSIHNLFLLDFAMRNNNNICRKIRQSIPCALSRTEIHTLAFCVQLYLHGTAMNIASSFFLFFVPFVSELFVIMSSSVLANEMNDQYRFVLVLLL